MNSYMNISVRVISANARAEIAALQKQVAMLQGKLAAANATAMAPGAVAGPRHRMSLVRWGSQLQWTGRQIQTNWTIPLAIAGGMAMKWQLQNEKAMTQVSKVYGDTQAAVDYFIDKGLTRQQAVMKVTDKETGVFAMELKALGDAFEALSSHYGVQQKEVIEVAGAWAAAGSSGLALAKSTELSIKTSILGNMDLAKATEALIAIQSQYSLSTGELNVTLAELNAIENQTGISLQGLVEGFSRSAGVAREAGIDVRHLGAMLAALVPATGSASTAGNSLKTIISRLMSPTQEAAQVMKEFGVNTRNAAWQSSTAMERLEILAGHMNNTLHKTGKETKSLSDDTYKLSDSQKQVVATVLGSRYQMNRFLVLMRELGPEQTYYEKALDATGTKTKALAQMHKELDNVLKSNPKRLEIIWYTLQNGMANAIQPMIPYLLYLADSVRRLVEKFQELPPGLQKFILLAAVVLALVGPLVRYFGSLMTLIGIMAKPLLLLGANFALFGHELKEVDGQTRRTKIGLGSLFTTMLLAPFKAVISGFGFIGGALSGLTRLFGINAMASKIWATIVANKWSWAGKAIILIHKALWGTLAVSWKAFFGALGKIVGAGWGWLTGYMAVGAAGAESAVVKVRSVVVTKGAAAREAIEAGSQQALNAIALGGGQQRLAIEAGQIREAIALDDGGRAARTAAFEAWIALQVSLAVNYFNGMRALEAGHHGSMLALESGSAAKRLALQVGNSVRMLMLDAGFYLRRLALQSGYAAQMLALEAGLTGRMLAIETAKNGMVLSLDTAFYARRAAFIIAWAEFLVTLDRGMFASRMGLTAGANASMLAIEAGGAAARAGAVGAGAAAETAAIAGSKVVQGTVVVAGETAMTAATATGTATRLAITSGGATATVGIFRKMWLAVLGSFKWIAVRLAGALATTMALMVTAVARAGSFLVKAFTGPWGWIISGIVIVVMHFRKQIAEAFRGLGDYLQENTHGMVQGILNAWNALPTGVQTAIMNVVHVVQAAAMQVKEWMGWMDPFQRHSPSLVEQVEGGMKRVGDSYGRAGKKSAGHIREIKREMSGLKAAIAAQEAVVKKWEARLDAANAALDVQQDKLDALQEVASGYQDALDAANTKLSNFASTPIEGLRAAEDAIFDNELAQKRLQLQMLKLADTGVTFDELKSKIDAVEGSVEVLRGKSEELRQAGAGSEITNVYDEQIAKLREQQGAYEQQIKPIDEMQQQLEALQHQAEIMDLEKSLKFDPLSHAIERASDRMKEMPFDQIMAGIHGANAEIDKYTPLVEKANAAVARQQDVVDALTDARDRISDRLDKERDKLSKLKDAYGTLEDATRKANKAASEYVTPGLQNFRDAKGGNFANVGGAGIPMRKNWKSQAKDIKDWVKDMEMDTSKMFGDLDPFSGIKKKWKQFKGWMKKAWDGFLSWMGGAFGSMSFGSGDTFAVAKQRLSDFGAWIKKWGKRLWELFGPTIIDTFHAIGDGLKKIWDEVWPEVKKFGDLFAPLLDGFRKNWKWLKPLLGLAMASILGFLMGLWNSVNGIIGPLMSWIGETLGEIIQIVRGVLEVVIGIFSFNGPLIWKGVKDIFGGVFSIIWNIIKWGSRLVWGGFSGFFKGIWRFFKWLWHMTKGWFKRKIFDPIVDTVVDTKDKVQRNLSKWWHGFTGALSNLKNGIKNWWHDKVWHPVTQGIHDWWENRLRVWGSWWGAIKKAWGNIKSGEWWHDKVMEPIRKKIKEGWDAVMTKMGDLKNGFTRKMTPAINVVIDAVNTLIRGLNKLSDLPGIEFHIDTIQRLAVGGPMMPRKANRGFKTNGARAIVGEGKSNYPEYVIPTDPTYRRRARGLLAAAMDKVGPPLHDKRAKLGSHAQRFAAGGVPMYGIGGIIGDLGKAGYNQVKKVAGKAAGGAKKIASWIMKPIIKLVKGKINDIDHPLLRGMGRFGLNKALEFIGLADQGFASEIKTASKKYGAKVSDPSNPKGHTTYRGGTFTRRFVAHLKAAEKDAQTRLQVMQGGFRPRTSYSGTSHQGDAVDSQPSWKLIMSLRKYGIASGDRTGLGDWAAHAHSVPGPSAGYGAGSAPWQFTDYMARGGAGQAINSPWGLARGAIIKAKRGGVWANIGEGRRDEAVVPLPRDWRSESIGGSSDKKESHVHLHGDLVLPNIKTGADAEELIKHLELLARD